MSRFVYWGPILGCGLVLGSMLSPQPARAQAPPVPNLAADAQAVLTKHCLRCHANEETDYLNVRSLDSLRKTTEGNEKPYVTPGKLEESLLWDYIRDRAASMPKSGDERRSFTDAQRTVIKDWILAGAPAFPVEPPRRFISLETMLRAIWTHAANAPAPDIASLRYFTLTHLHNNNDHVRSNDLRMTRAALAKALNSLTWAQTLVLPEEVPGTEGTVLVVNLSKLGWGTEEWRAITRAYPYDLGYNDDRNLRDLDDKLSKHLGPGTGLIHLRADWFVATATRPPLYHQILFESQLPALKQRPSDPRRPDNPRSMTALDLEDHLRVNVLKNLKAGTPEVLRAGFPTSGVSGQNRLIERHPMAQGAYWKSYDFKASTRRGNLQQFPLGPIFKDNQYPKLAFEHDGGEIIFHLPNGLQGYLLVDGKDHRIDAGPIEVVSDSASTSGTPVIVNGLSCIACHKNGIRPAPADQVRAGRSVGGDARERVLLLYPEKKVLDDAIARDQELFLRSLERTIGPFLRHDEAGKKVPITEFAEPVSEVARRYHALREDLDAVTVACELYLQNPADVIQKATGSAWRELGLGALAFPGGRIKRAAWDSPPGSSQMGLAAREFGYFPRE